MRELKEHPFFAGVNWSGLIRETAPWVPPPAKDLDMSNFPRAQSKSDSGLRKLIEEEGLDGGDEVENKKETIKKLTCQEFNKFNGVSYGALQSINEREGEKAQIWAQRQIKKMQKEGKMSKVENRFADEPLFSKKSDFQPRIIKQAFGDW